MKIRLSRDAFRVLSFVLFIAGGIAHGSCAPEHPLYRGISFFVFTMLFVGFTGWKLMIEVDPADPLNGRAVMKGVGWGKWLSVAFFFWLASLAVFVLLPLFHKKSDPETTARPQSGSPAVPEAGKSMPPAPEAAAARIDTEAWTRVTEDPSILLSIAYADTANFTRRRLYDCPECLLRPEAATALYKARDLAAKDGLQLLLFDCYRPQSVQRRLYDFLPDKTYVADPTKGSKHSRGCAVDATLARNGTALDMGSTFDDMSPRAGYDWGGLSEPQRANRRRLRDLFTAAGFAPYANEWWHFSCKACAAPVSDYHWPCP